MGRIRIVIPVTAIAMAAATVFVEAQRIAPLTGATQTEIVANAEKEGAVFAVDARQPIRTPKAFLDQTIAGDSGRRCVAATGNGPVRSGEFVVTGLLSGPLDKRSNRLKVAWAPLHHAPEMSITVRARMVGTGEATEFYSNTVASPNGAVAEPERDYFFPSGIVFAKAGTWVVVATSGSDWGCFVLNVT